MKKIIIYMLICLFFVPGLMAQDRQQLPGIPKAKKPMTLILKGNVYNKVSNQLVPNADVTIREASQQKVLAEVKADANGFYTVTIPRGVDLDIKAQAPELFYDTWATRVSIRDSVEEIEHDFYLPSELQLRLNFPTNKFDNPYPFVLDDDGNESTDTWQLALEQVAEDLNKYKDYISKIIITGHTDSDGSDAANMKLGENRAQFLFDELQKRGVPVALMEVKSAGENELLEKKQGESGSDWKKRCRRVVMSKEMKKR